MDARLKISVSGKSGFTLIEVLMAMLILTVGLLGLLQSVNIAYEHNLRTRLREEAVTVAEEQLNLMRTHRVLDPITTASQMMGGIRKEFVVTRNASPIGGDATRLTVAVRWGFKNLSTTHEIYTIKKM